MLGFFTLVAFVLALSAGGWFWLFFLVMLGAWGNKLEEKKKAKAGVDSGSAKPPETNRPKPFQGESCDWETRLVEICSRYTANGFYVAELIPDAKLQSARKSYPTPGDGKVIALVDTTIMGGAEDGMAIGRDGVAWHNWARDPKDGTLSWEDFSETTLSLDGSTIKFGGIGVFDTMGNGLGKVKIIELLGAIQVGYVDYSKRVAPRSTDGKRADNVEVDVNRASFDDLLSLPGIGAAEAKLILDKRASGARFTSLDELAEFLNLKPHKVEQLRNRIVFPKPVSPSQQDIAPKRPDDGAPPAPAPTQPVVPGRVVD